MTEVSLSGDHATVRGPRGTTHGYETAALVVVAQAARDRDGNDAEPGGAVALPPGDVSGDADLE